MANIHELFGKVKRAVAPDAPSWQEDPTLLAAHSIKRTVVDHAHGLKEGPTGRIGYRFPGQLNGQNVEYAIEGYPKMSLGTPVNSLDDTRPVNVRITTDGEDQTLTLFPQAAKPPSFSDPATKSTLPALRDSIVKALIPQPERPTQQAAATNPISIFSR